MTFTTGRLAEGTLTKAELAITLDRSPALIVPGPFRRAAAVVSDLLEAVAIVLCIPFVILVIGIPIALCLRLLLWMGGLL